MGIKTQIGENAPMMGRSCIYGGRRSLTKIGPHNGSIDSAGNPFVDSFELLFLLTSSATEALKKGQDAYSGFSQLKFMKKKVDFCDLYEQTLQSNHRLSLCRMKLWKPSSISL